MFFGRCAAIAYTALLSMVEQASAAMLYNHDPVSYSITVEEGENKHEYKLAAFEFITDFCDDGCILHATGIEGEYVVRAKDVLMIRRGVIRKVNK